MAYEIQFITDTRDKGTRKKLSLMDKRLKTAMKKLEGVKIRDKTGIRELSFEKGRTRQWRKSYIVSKSKRKPTWNEVMTEINKIYAPYYKKW